MKHFYLSASILLSFAFTSYSQENPGPRATAMGNTGFALQEVWSLQSNQAGLTVIKRPVAALSYRNNFLNPEISTQSAVFALPIKNNIVGISLQSYGFALYNEQKAGICYARSFGNTISASLNFNIHQVKIQNYGDAKTYSVDAGFQYKAFDKLIIGTHISNPYRSSFDTEVDAVVPVSIGFGAAYTFSDKLLLNSGVIKTLNALSDVRLGFEYSIVNHLALRGGIALQSSRQFAGFGYRYQNLILDAAVSIDPNLGYSPQFSLGYEF